MAEQSALYGVSAEFSNAAALVAATRRLQQAGFANVETYAPYPIPALQPLAGARQALPRIAFFAGLVGFVGGLGLQQYATVLSYPLDIGGRPLDSWPMYLPSVYEAVVGLAVLAAVLAFLWLARLPRYCHPIFAAPRFDRATSDGFFLLVALPDPGSYDRLHEELRRCRPLATSDLLAG
jgi:hypothetical protein